MVFNENECLHLARYLVGKQCGPCTKEASQRAAVSRAYIAAFVFVRNFEFSNHDYRPKGNALDHKLLNEHLRRRGATKTLSDLYDLSVKRGEYDYNGVVLGTEVQKEQKVRDAIRLSEDIIREIQ
jgi:hypothetical protein